MSIYNAKWIKTDSDCVEIVPQFSREFCCEGEISSAVLEITALGVYCADINGSPVSDYVLAPGWTVYEKRLQYQVFDVTNLLKNENKISISVGRGWRFHKMKAHATEHIASDGVAVLASLKISYADGRACEIVTDSSWSAAETEVVYNDMYNGETYDFSREARSLRSVEFPHSYDILLLQQGEKIVERECLEPAQSLVTPRGERVIDFAQELTGYLEFNCCGKAGARLKIKHFEVLDSDGNVYIENLRSARQELNIICDGKEHKIKPRYTFYGFRYIVIETEGEVEISCLKAHAVYSDMKRTGSFECSNSTLNRFYENVLWGQRGNFLDVPTDCPQRNERMGWTGDAQVFCRAATYNYDVEKFFDKWLYDLAAEQREDGGITDVAPIGQFGAGSASPAWADAACIIPWQLYLAYGNKEILANHYPTMEKWVQHMLAVSRQKGKEHGCELYHPWTEQGYGDWLALDRFDKGDSWSDTPKGLIGTAYFAYSTELLIKAGEVLGRDMSFYRELYADIKRAFGELYIGEDKLVRVQTQTAYVLAICFDLAEDKQANGRRLAELILQNGGHLRTGFVGAPLLLHALTATGQDELAVSLLLREEFPSWLYSVTKGATTIWERWNGIKPDGSFADAGMNSFNHYAYGSVADWLFARLAGLKPNEAEPAYRSIEFTPYADERLDYVRAELLTRNGLVRSEWRRTCAGLEFYFLVPQGCKASAVIGGKKYSLTEGENTISV